MKVNVEMTRKYGLVPMGRFSNNTALKLFNGLIKDYETINISINHIENRKDNWKIYKLIRLEGTDCVLQEIKYQLPKDATPEKVLRGEVTSIPVLQDNIIKFNACDICQMDGAYMARIDVE